ncbi:hypothetical protein E9232_003417 [Inquilinus ginsengisoli]|uniref:Serine protease n=1 Tax=Inquilinus ginsengisoli TaxID=363840 RepID=A0ABU1JQJ6_9PROT|nr:hypothetical protein [Inquilinus ginsengisoli]MDR6290891.1 hypothetical protein [Inquilinus ginsengisoli]
MPQSMRSVMTELIAFECRDPNNNGKFVGSGTAFWANVNGDMLLLSASHIPWPPPEDSPGQLQFPGVTHEFDISWVAAKGRNSGRALVSSHPTSYRADYCIIDFTHTAPTKAPPGRAFRTSMTPIQLPSSIIAFGFPGGYHPSLTPPVHCAAGKLLEVRQGNGYSSYLVDGSAMDGYSGGPAFVAIDREMVDDLVVGLMSGKPAGEHRRKHGLQNGFVLFGSDGFAK